MRRRCCAPTQTSPAWQAKNWRPKKRPAAALRERIEQMGPVNMMALEEYKETAERHSFLDAQRKDLIESIENTQETIKEIDRISRTKFDEAFVRINENFGRTFERLFHGGQAFLRLTDIENQEESGLEIVASPPGKKLQNVLLLSGGEKSLTALALLMGIFQYKPSPFCALDEVDAALDETNAGRFADLLALAERRNAVPACYALQAHDAGRRNDLRRDHAGSGRLKDRERAAGPSRAAEGDGVKAVVSCQLSVVRRRRPVHQTTYPQLVR